MLLFATAVVVATAGTVPKDAANEYPVHAEVNGVTIGAEYFGRAFFAPEGEPGAWLAEDHLVIEVALFSKERDFTINTSKFTLRLDGRKQALPPESPQVVAASLKYPDWNRRPGVIVAGGVGDAGVILGAPPRTERFPGDPTARTRLPAPPRAPEPEHRSGQEPQPKMTAAEAVVATALPEGEVRLPVSGYLYFPYKGKLAKLRSVELLFDGVALKLK